MSKSSDFIVGPVCTFAAVLLCLSECIPLNFPWNQIMVFKKQNRLYNQQNLHGYY